jgi:EAL domain-containing protein (putative c-di-GMP-specific phosphodiesterase class I)
MSNCLDGDVTELWGMEALLRWEHPERGLVSPVDFIPVAEETGLIVDIGNWVINEACRQWTQWNEAGLAPERIAVNVSQRQFSLSDVAKTVEEALATHAIPPSALEIEITESCMMDASSNVIESLEYIRRLGVHVAMDDFGTGHSSLGALTQLPIDTLKVDRCFVSGLEQGSANDTIVAAVLMLADTLDLTVVAEGVETTEELERLQWHRCDVGQGYLLARPLWEADATAMLQARAQCVAGDNEAHGKAA